MGPQGPAGSANINGTTNTLIKFTSATTGGNSSVTDDGTTLTTSDRFDVGGGLNGSYDVAPIEIRTVNTPRISFHWPGVVASQLGMDSAGVIRTYNNPGNAYERFAAADITSNGFIYGTGDIRADGVVYWGNGLTRTETKNNADATGSRSGFYETSAPVNFYPGSSSWQHLIDVRHSNGGNNYAMQIAGSFFDQDLWYRKTNNNGTTAWLQLIGAGPRNCTAPFNAIGATVTAASGGVTRSNTICGTTFFAAQNYNNAQNICAALGGHIQTYNEGYRFAQAFGINNGNVMLNGDWIGHRTGDDGAYCVNNQGDINNFEGNCDKNNARMFRCVQSSDLND